MDRDRRLEASNLPVINEIVERFVPLLEKPGRNNDVSFQALNDRLREADAKLLIEKLESDYLEADRDLIDRQRLLDIRTRLWTAASYLGTKQAMIEDRSDSIPGYDDVSERWKSYLELAEIALVDRSRNRREELYAGLRLLVKPQESTSA
jgi:hypothetical protein